MCLFHVLAHLAYSDPSSPGAYSEAYAQALCASTSESNGRKGHTHKVLT